MPLASLIVEYVMLYLKVRVHRRMAGGALMAFAQLIHGRVAGHIVLVLLQRGYVEHLVHRAGLLVPSLYVNLLCRLLPLLRLLAYYLVIVEVVLVGVLQELEVGFNCQVLCQALATLRHTEEGLIELAYLPYLTRFLTKNVLLLLILIRALAELDLARRASYYVAFEAEVSVEVLVLEHFQLFLLAHVLFIHYSNLLS